MAMGAVKGQTATLQVEMVCLDELVPEDDRYRRLDELVDWSFVRLEAAPYYADELGRPSVDPIVLVKLMLAAALEGIGSVRELLRIATMRLDLRRFLGYGFSERLPVHQTVSHAQTRRFVDRQLFERLFLRSVAVCREHDLIEGTHLSVDGFLRGVGRAFQPAREPHARPRAPRRRRRVTCGPRARGRGRPRAPAAFPRRAALGADAQAPQLEPDLAVPYRSRRQAQRQARPAPSPRSPRPGRGRPQGALCGGLPRRARRRPRGRRARGDDRQGAL